MDSKICPNCNTSLPGGFRICGKCGTRLESNEAMVDTTNSDPSGAIRALIGPGFAGAQPVTRAARPLKGRRRPGMEELSRAGKKVKRPRDPLMAPKRPTRFQQRVTKPASRPAGSGSRDLTSRRSRPLPGGSGPPRSGSGAHTGIEPITPGLACTGCGAEMPATNKFCGKCGSAVQQPRPVGPPSCINCGAKGTPGQRFCGRCGNPF